MSQLDDSLAKLRAQTARAQPSAELLVRLDALAQRPHVLPYVERSRPTHRYVPLAAAAVLIIVTGAAMFALRQPKPITASPVEPDELVANQPIEDSFGFGAGVTWLHPDLKVFDFEFKPPVKTVMVLHYQASDISKNELLISVNGTDVGHAPADTVAVNERSNEALIPPNALVRNGKNKIVFESTRKKQPWRIWNIWVEVFPLPELSREQLVQMAQENLGRGQDFWDRRKVSQENLYQAWRAYREAWLTLESIEGERPIEYAVARDKMHEAQASLDALCSQLLLDAQSRYNQKQFSTARETLEQAYRYFPKRDQVCPMRVDATLRAYGL